MKREPVASVRGRSFRTSLPPDVLMRIQQATLRGSYRGLRLLKNPFDLQLYGLLIDRLAPRTVIEIGTSGGGGAVWFADQLGLRDIPGRRVVSVDQTLIELGDTRVTLLEGDALVLGRTLSDELLATLPRPWLVVEDSAHTHPVTRAVMDFFAPRLQPGEYLVVEDGNLADFPDPLYDQFEDGPNRAVKAFLEEQPGVFDIDVELCDHFGPNVTWAPNGWLRRR